MTDKLEWTLFPYFREQTRLQGEMTEFICYAAYYWGQRGIGTEYGTKTYPASTLVSPSAKETNREHQELLSFISK